MIRINIVTNGIVFCCGKRRRYLVELKFLNFYLIRFNKKQKSHSRRSSSFDFLL